MTSFRFLRPPPSGRCAQLRMLPAGILRLDQPLLGAVEGKLQPVQVVQTTAPAWARTEALSYILPYRLPVPVGQFYSCRGGQPLHCLFQLLSLRVAKGGGTAGLLQYQGFRLSFAEGRRSPRDGVGVSLQCLGCRRCFPALGQRSDGVPPLPLLDVGARIILRRRSLIPICHCSRDRSKSLIPIINPPQLSKPRNPTGPLFTLCLCTCHLGFGLV